MSRGANLVRPIALTLLALGFALNNPSAFAGEARKPVRSLLEIREDRVIVQKWETSCAAAALATVLTFSHNDPVTEKSRHHGHVTDHRPNQGQGSGRLFDAGYETFC
jgi:hypothetical protein